MHEEKENTERGSVNIQTFIEHWLHSQNYLNKDLKDIWYVY